jgi:FkbH-like protein
MYQSDIVRNEIKESFEGTENEFLASLGLNLWVYNAREDDLQRAEELTVRTHQLNSTGYTYSFDELKSFINSTDYILLVSDLTDKYGYYGKIGLTLIHCSEDEMRIKLLLTSCRVMNRGVGTALLTLIIMMARKQNKKLTAEFVPTDRNRIMAVTNSIMGFQEIGQDGDTKILQYNPKREPILPDYMNILTDFGFESKVTLQEDMAKV